MFYFYLFAAVAGCLLVGVSMAGLGSSDGDGDADGDADGDVEALGDGEHGSHALESGHHGGGHHSSFGTALSGLGAAASMMFSLQLWTYLLAFGGVTGLLLRSLAHVGEPAAGICALAVGLGTGFTARRVMRRMTAIGDSGTVEQEKLIGVSAQVLIPADPGRTGKIRLSARGHLTDLMARSSDGKALLQGVEVVIVDMKDGVAEVTSEMPELQSDASRNALAARSAIPEAPPSTKG